VPYQSNMSNPNTGMGAGSNPSAGDYNTYIARQKSLVDAKIAALQPIIQAAQNKPIGDYAPPTASFGESAAMYSGTGLGSSLLKNVGAATVGGAVAGSVVPGVGTGIGAVAGATIATAATLLGALFNAYKNTKQDELKGAGAQATQSGKGINQWISIANANDGSMTANQLIENYEQEKRDIYQAEAFLMRNMNAARFVDADIAKQLEWIEQFKQQEAYYDARFYNAVINPDPTQIDVDAFLMQNEQTQTAA